MDPLWHVIPPGDKLIAEQKTQRTKPYFLLNLFRINDYMPHPDHRFFDWNSWRNVDKRNYLSKKYKLMTPPHLLDEERVSQVIHYSRKYPIVIFAVDALCLTYDQWSGERSNEENAQVEKKLDTLHSNFTTLLETIADLEKTVNLKELLPIAPKYTPQREMETLDAVTKKSKYTMTSDLLEHSAILYEALAPYFIDDQPETGGKQRFAEILTQAFGDAPPLLDSVFTREWVAYKEGQTNRTDLIKKRIAIKAEIISQFKHPTCAHLDSYFPNPRPQKIDQPFSKILERLQTNPLFKTPESAQQKCAFEEKLRAFTQEIQRRPKIRQEPFNRACILFQALHSAKAWAARQRTIPPLVPKLHESESAIYPLKDRQGKSIAMLKEGRRADAKILEQLAWNAACIFEVEKHFVPTTTTTLHYHQTGLGATHYLDWRFCQTGLTLARLDTIDRGLSGSIQPALIHLNLAEWFQKDSGEKPPITKTEIIKATLITLLFAMFDAHCKNIFVLDDGSLVFFDNTRNFANGDVILWEESILPGYRSGLLEFPESYEPLTEEEIGHIIKQIETFEEKIPTFERYLIPPNFRNREKRTKVFEKKLPEDWFHTEWILEGMKVRLNRIKQACRTATPDFCLRDLVFAANPTFKFSAALRLAAYTDLKKRTLTPESTALIQIHSLPSVGANSVQKLIDECLKKQIDVRAIKEACENPELSFKGFIQNLIEKQMYFGTDVETRAVEVLETFVHTLVPDFKDVSLETFTVTPARLNVLNSIMLLRLKNRGFNMIKWEATPTETQLMQAVESYLHSDKKYVIVPPFAPQENAKYTLFFKNDEQNVVSVHIDFTSTPSKLMVEKYRKPPLTFDKFKKICDTLPTSLEDELEEKEHLAVEVENILQERGEEGQATPTITSVLVLPDNHWVKDT